MKQKDIGQESDLSIACNNSALSKFEGSWFTSVGKKLTICSWNYLFMPFLCNFDFMFEYATHKDSINQKVLLYYPKSVPAF